MLTKRLSKGEKIGESTPVIATSEFYDAKEGDESAEAATWDILGGSQPRGAVVSR